MLLPPTVVGTPDSGGGSRSSPVVSLKYGLARSDYGTKAEWTPKRIPKAESLPSLPSSRGEARGDATSPSRSPLSRSPLSKAQVLYTVEVGQRKLVKEKVRGGVIRAKSVERSALGAPGEGFMLPERSLTLPEILKSVREDLNIDRPPTGTAKKTALRRAKNCHWGGSGLYRSSPSRARRPSSEHEIEIEVIDPEAAFRLGSTLTPAPGSPPTQSQTQFLLTPERSDTAASKRTPRGQGSLSLRSGRRSRLGVRQVFQGAPVAILPVEEEEAPVEEVLVEAQPPAPKEEEDDDWVLWEDGEMREVFARFDHDHDGELHVDDLVNVIRELGGRAHPQDIQRIVREQTQYATLSWEEFIVFLKNYRRMDITRWKEVFTFADTNEDSAIDLYELQALLIKYGYAPTMDAVEETLRCLDKDEDHKLNFKEFQALNQYLRKYQGATQAEVSKLGKLWEKIGRSTPGKAAPSMLKQSWLVANYLGYPLKEQVFERILIEVDMEDGDGEIKLTEKMKIMRRVRDKERKIIRNVMVQYGHAPVGNTVVQVLTHQTESLAAGDLDIVLAELGYHVSEGAIQEVLTDNEFEDEFSLDNIQTFLRCYRESEGFTDEEKAEFQKVFQKEVISREKKRGTPSSPRSRANLANLDFSSPSKRRATMYLDRPMELNTMGLSRVLRWFGFAAPMQEVQSLLEEFDLQSKNVLDFEGFLKVVRRLRQEEAKTARSIFDKQNHKRGGTGFIPVDSIQAILGEYEGTVPDLKLVASAISRSMDKVAVVDRSGGAAAAAALAALPQCPRDDAPPAPGAPPLSRSCSKSSGRSSASRSSVVRFEGEESATHPQVATPPLAAGGSQRGSRNSRSTGLWPPAVLEQLALKAKERRSSSTGPPSTALSPGDGYGAAAAARGSHASSRGSLALRALEAAERRGSGTSSMGSTMVRHEQQAPEIAVESRPGSRSSARTSRSSLLTLDEEEPSGDEASFEGRTVGSNRRARPETPRGMVSRRGFQAIFYNYRKLAAQQTRSWNGYSATEVAKLRDAFDALDADKSGTIEPNEFRGLIAQYFPDATRSREDRQMVVEALAQVDKDNSETLDFDEFLRLARLCDDLRDQKDMVAEQVAIQDCKLCAEEVEGFRQVFSSSADWTGEMDVPTLVQMFGTVMHLSLDQTREIREFVRELHPHSREVVRFPQFLRLVSRMMSSNFGGINNEAALVARREKLRNHFRGSVKRALSGFRRESFLGGI